jgi:hypothetical protein
VRRIIVTASTLGQSNPAELEGRRNYTWNGDPAKSEAARTVPYVAKPDGGPGSTARKQARLDGFAAALSEQGYDVWTATGKAVVEAGRRVGVGYETARGYRNELKRQQIRDGEVTDA